MASKIRTVGQRAGARSIRARERAAYLGQTAAGSICQKPVGFGRPAQVFFLERVPKELAANVRIPRLNGRGYIADQLVAAPIMARLDLLDALLAKS